MNNHLMLDFETLGNRPDTAVLSFGAALFDREKGIKSDVYMVPNLKTQLRTRRADADTLAWWFKQGDEAKLVFEEASMSGMQTTEFVSTFFDWLTKALSGESSNSLRIWSNGANFDIPILTNLIESTNQQIHWQFFNERCYRTMKALHGIEKGVVREAKHHAGYDAIYQATCLYKFLAEHPELDK